MSMDTPVVAGALALFAAMSFGLALFIFGPIYLWGASVPGRVDEVIHSGNSSKSCRPVISYTVDDASYELRSQVSSSPCAFEEGETVTVSFSRRNPSNGYTVGGGNTFGLLVLMAAGLALSYQSVRVYIRSRRQVDAGAERPPLAVVPLLSAPQGARVGIRGTVEKASGELTAPMSGRRCVAFEVEVRTPVFGEVGELLHRASGSRPFTLRDESGAVAILGEGTATDVHLAPDLDGETEAEPDERLTDLLTHAGFDILEARTTDNHYQWTEGIVREGDVVTVFGALSPQSETAAGYRAGAQRFDIMATPDAEVVIATGDARTPNA